MKCKAVRLLEENVRDYFGINESLLNRIQKVPEILKIKMKTVVFIKKKKTMIMKRQVIQWEMVFTTQMSNKWLIFIKNI